MTDAIVVEWLVKRFGATTAVGGVGLTVAEGSVPGLLGTNGAGRTTVVRILTSSRPLSWHPGSLAVGVLFALQRSCRTPTARAAPLKRQDGRR
jgi:ABC-type multidrug transport system ATPase subunit